MNIFGFEIRRKTMLPEENPDLGFSIPTYDDGAIVVPSTNGMGSYVDFDGGLKSESDIIGKYRDMSCEPEMDMAISAIINEAVAKEDNNEVVNIDCSDLEEYIPPQIIEIIRAEFDYIKGLLDFEKFGHEIFRRWYVDGRIYFNVIIDNANPAGGIVELRSLDARKTRKVREVAQSRLPNGGASIIQQTDEYYIYSDRADPVHPTLAAANTIKITKDSIIDINSGLVDKAGKFIMSYLHKAIKPLNQLRMLEDATVIYRLARAPERRAWSIDVGNLPPLKANQVMKETMTRYRNRMVYDAATGQISDDRKFMTMTEDFWLARRADGSGPSVTTLQGGQNLGEITDVEYFKQRLLEALNVPISRLNPEDNFSLGRTSEITRDELAFQKFINRVRTKFAELFYEALGKQLVLKQVMTIEEWDQYKNRIKLIWSKDNYFSELKASEILRDRLATLQAAWPYIGFVLSQEFVFKQILNLTDEQRDEMISQIQAEGLPLWLRLQQAPE